MPENTDRFVWVDIETTGLEPTSDVVLEIGVVITDVNLREIDSRAVQIWDTPLYDTRHEYMAKYENDRFVFDMHTKSGLWDDCMNNGTTQHDAERIIAEFLLRHGVEKEPMCGSSVHFDRGFLAEQYPAIAACFGYRNIDISTIKEVCMRLNPDLYAKLDGDHRAPKRGLHRAIPDIEDTINEFRWYSEEFLILPWIVD